MEAGLPPTQVRVAPALRGLVEHRRLLVEGCAALRPLAEHELWRPKRTAPFVLHHPHLGRARRLPCGENGVSDVFQPSDVLYPSIILGEFESLPTA